MVTTSTDKTVDYSGLIAAMGFDDRMFSRLPRDLVNEYALCLALLQESLGWCTASPELAIQCETTWMFGDCIGGTLTPPLGPNRRTAPQLIAKPFEPRGSYGVMLELNGQQLIVVFRLPVDNLYCLDIDELLGINMSRLHDRVDIIDADGNVVGTGSNRRTALRDLTDRANM